MLDKGAKTLILTTLAAGGVSFTVSALVIVGVCHVIHRSEAVPSLIEFYTSESCINCPVAENMLDKVLDHDSVPGVKPVFLEFHVEYGNKPGRKDPYASLHNLIRQGDYALSSGKESVYTPQIIVDGSSLPMGSGPDAVLEAMKRAVDRPKLPIHVQLEQPQENQVTAHLKVADVVPPDAEIWLATVEDGVPNRALKFDKRGPETHRGVVRNLQMVKLTQVHDHERLGSITIPLKPAWNRENLRLVVFAQETAPGPILALGQCDRIP